MRYSYISVNLRNDVLDGRSGVYDDEWVETVVLKHDGYVTTNDGVVFKTLPGVKAAFYIPETHPLFNALMTPIRLSDFKVDDVTHKQLMSYINK